MNTGGSKQHFRSFWFGPSLTPYEELCIRSFLDHGHSFCVYSYERLQLPRGAQQEDAGKILPREELFVYPSGPGKGGVSAFANRFRYALLLQEGGWWVDMDMVCLTDDFPGSHVFFALEEEGRVNNAILRFPPQHAVMRDCLDHATRMGSHIEFGATGPKLLTEKLAAHDLDRHASSSATCYPLHWRDYMLQFDPARREFMEDLTAHSITYHMWNEMLRRSSIDKNIKPPVGSFLEALMRRHGVRFTTGAYDFSEIQYLDKMVKVRAGIKRRLDFVRGKLLGAARGAGLELR